VNDLDKQFAQHILKSIDDTEYWFREVLRTKIPGTDKALTDQQLAFVRDFDALYSAKAKKIANLKHPDLVPELTQLELDLAAMYGESVQSGKGTGKTTVAAGLALKILVCHKRSITLILGASYDQTKSTIWAEMNRLLQGSIIADDVHIGAEKAFLKDEKDNTFHFVELRATNVSENQQKQAKKFAGYHADVQVFIFDEATGISRPVFTEMESTLGYKFGVSIMLVFYNPDVPVCYAVETQTIKRDFFLCHHWDAELSELVDEEYIRKRKEEFGEESPEYLVWVKGLLPPASNDALLPWAWLQQAVNNRFEVDPMEPLVFSYDSKGQGKCEAVHTCSQGGITRWQKANNEPDTVLQADLVYQQVIDELEHHPKNIRFTIVIETDGIGYGVWCDMKHHSSGLIKYTRAVNVGSKCRDTKGFRKYECVRDKLWNTARRAVQEGTEQLPDERKLINQLGSMKFSTKTGKWKAMPKKELAVSPDRADSWVLKFAINMKRVYNRNEANTSSRIYDRPQRTTTSNGWLTR
jgi:hypothetical protein